MSPVTAGSLARLASAPPTPISLGILYHASQHAKRSQNLLPPSKFIHSELPIRLARLHALLTSQQMPHNMSSLPSIRAMALRTREDISSLLDAPIPDSANTEAHFAGVAADVAERGEVTMRMLARAFGELYAGAGGVVPGEEWGGEEADAFFDRMHALHVGAHLLLSEHAALRSASAHPLVTPLSPTSLATRAAADARTLCARLTGSPHACPEIIIIDNLPPRAPPTLAVAPHVHRVLLDLLANALRATADTRRPVRVVVSRGAEDSFRAWGQGR
ncbi:hypothetical protein BDK51DRAFT_39941 [Blyttiomyces helicus]|uniref:Protein-serine/threonine kinase n=1 Tax=Blyttiomyces helicus TaxID=388810 RepID=A0A4P9WAZ7_9FUNG|nr:hypothetical protein BDK51DRAFT_39941 [Blyttiomyces helicus]|eukprot:RKO88070.1 hypothetical protein BDK51DRAFT_39941 [Blyttiomyces helicus]